MRRLAALSLAALAVAGCGGSAPKGPSAVVFVSTRDGDYAFFGSTANGKHVHRLTAEKGNTQAPEALLFQGDPAWSPDGTKIVFDSRRDNTFHIYVMSSDGTGTRRLTDSNREDTRPTWSPDSRRIVFSRSGALYSVAATGGAATPLFALPGSAEDPWWSPDGKWLAYDYQAHGQAYREIWLAHPDGSGKRKLTDLHSTSARPVWSPDGTQLAFESDVYAGRPEIYTVPIAGGDPKRLTHSAIDAIQPDWGSDGTLVFSADGAIWTDSGGKQKQITSEADNDTAPAWRPSTAQ